MLKPIKLVFWLTSYNRSRRRRFSHFKAQSVVQRGANTVYMGLNLPYVKLPVTWLQEQRFLQVLLNNMNLSLIINVLQQLISIMGYQNASTCQRKIEYDKQTLITSVTFTMQGINVTSSRSQT